MCTAELWLNLINSCNFSQKTGLLRLLRSHIFLIVFKTWRPQSIDLWNWYISVLFSIRIIAKITFAFFTVKLYSVTLQWKSLLASNYMFKVNNKTFTPCSSVSIVNFKQVNTDWVYAWKPSHFSSFKTVLTESTQILAV